MNEVVLFVVGCVALLVLGILCKSLIRGAARRRRFAEEAESLLYVFCCSTDPELQQWFTMMFGHVSHYSSVDQMTHGVGFYLSGDDRLEIYRQIQSLEQKSLRGLRIVISSVIVHTDACIIESDIRIIGSQTPDTRQTSCGSPDELTLENLWLEMADATQQIAAVLPTFCHRSLREPTGKTYHQIANLSKAIEEYLSRSG